MTITRSASERIVDEVTSWRGVRAVEGERGELSLRLGGRELGHLHGDRTLHIAFPKAVWQELYDEGRVEHHPVFPGRPGWAARRLEDEEDIADALVLLRMNYDRAIGRSGAPAA